MQQGIGSLFLIAALSLPALLPTCAPEGADLTGATWVLDLPTEWGETPEGLTPTEVTLEFVPDDGTVVGAFAYQKYTGAYAVDGSAISFEQLGWTTFCCMAAAGTLSREQAYLFALGDAQSYRIVDNTLTIHYGDQELTFHRT